MKLNQIQPITPHIEGVIRFASHMVDGELRQLDHFEVLARHHDGVDTSGRPKLATHEIEKSLLGSAPQGKEKLRTIPIRLICDDPANSLSARYDAFDMELNRLACTGDGSEGRRASFADGRVVDVACNGPEACEYANSTGVHCSLRVRMHLQIEGQVDAFSVFEFQSGSINSYRTLSAKLRMMYASFGKRLRHIPLQLAMYAKSSEVSCFEHFFVADLQLREGMSPGMAVEAAAKACSAEGSAGLHFDEMEAEVARIRSNAQWFLGDSEGVDQVVPFDHVDRQRLSLRTPRPSSTPVPLVSIKAVVEKALQHATEAPADGCLVSEPEPVSSPTDSQSAPTDLSSLYPRLGEAGQVASAETPILSL